MASTEGQYASLLSTRPKGGPATTVDADELRRRHVEFGEVPQAVLDFMDDNS
jgi:hypothetical protein